MSAYIDVRGPWPVYVRGMIAVELHDVERRITVEEAEYWFNVTLNVPFTSTQEYLRKRFEQLNLMHPENFPSYEKFLSAYTRKAE